MTTADAFADIRDRLAYLEETLNLEDMDEHGLMLLASGPRSPQWHIVRGLHLEEFPTCAACGTKKSLEVHHLLPFHIFPKLELEQKNLMTLCEYRNCHLRIGHSFCWSSYNPNAAEDAAQQLMRIQKRLSA